MVDIREGLGNGDYVVVDTSSLNGTYVNRKPVESKPPANGNEIQMGKLPSGVPQPAHDALTSTRLAEAVFGCATPC